MHTFVDQPQSIRAVELCVAHQTLPYITTPAIRGGAPITERWRTELSRAASVAPARFHLQNACWDKTTNLHSSRRPIAFTQAGEITGRFTVQRRVSNLHLLLEHSYAEIYYRG